MSRTGPSEEAFTRPQLSALLLQALNPEPAVQAELAVALSGGSDGAVAAALLVKYVGCATCCYCSLPHVTADVPVARMAAADEAAGERVAVAWLHDLLFDGDSQKKTAGKDVPDKTISQECVERWLLGHSALFAVVQFTVLRTMVAPLLMVAPSLLPMLVLPKSVSPHLCCPELLLLSTALPPLLRCQWRLLFSNHIHGDSFSLLMKQIVGAGPTVVLAEDEEGNKFGGFAAAPWEVRPQFHGTAECFLVTLRPWCGVYRTTGYNTNYQYLNYLHNNTMPNGLGMGGREELFGMFLSHEFGECRVAPSCTTFQSPPLCHNQTPKVRYLTVWGVGEEPQDSSDEEEDGVSPKKRSALDKNPDAQAMLDMIGRTRASDGLREPDPDSE